MFIVSYLLIIIHVNTPISRVALLPLPDEYESLLSDGSASGLGNRIWTGMEFSSYTPTRNKYSVFDKFIPFFEIDNKILPGSFFPINFGPLAPTPFRANIWGYTISWACTLSPHLRQGLNLLREKYQNKTLN